MELKSTYCCLFLTVLAANFYSNVAEVNAEQHENDIRINVDTSGIGANQNIRENIERYIKTKIEDSMDLKQTKIDKLDLNIDKDIKLTADKILLELDTEITKIIDKKNFASTQTKILESINKVNKHLETLENENKLIRKDIQKLLNNTEQGPPIEHGNGLDVCVVNVPSTVKTNNDIWINRDTPKIDDLDTYMNMTRGCHYEAVKFYRQSYYFIEHSFNETLIETQFALRTHDSAHIRVWWRPADSDYIIDIGVQNNTVTKLIDHKTSKVLLTQPTPGILSADNYVEFYIKIDKDTLKFGKKCEKPLIAHDFSIGRRDTVNMSFESYSIFGGKLLHDCPID